MFVVVPDPHPGRCPNVRPSRDVDGYPTNVRCLESSTFPHVCRFPKPPQRVRTNVVYSTGDYQPKRWVRPSR